MTSIKVQVKIKYKNPLIPDFSKKIRGNGIKNTVLLVFTFFLNHLSE